MYRYQILIEYVGTSFIGWQIQKKGKSVQRIIQSTLSKLLKQKIIQYKGKKVSLSKVEEDPKFDNDKEIYLFNLNKRYDLDGNVPWNTARLINHSCSNNCDYEGTGLKIWVISNKEVKKGEEITCDYGFSYDSDYKQFPCKCKSINCCGYIVRTESRWRINKKFKKNIRISR